jgi:hypothetical protein
MTTTDEDSDSVRFVIDEALFHLNRAKEILDEGMRDPDAYRMETRENYRFMAPYVTLMLMSFMQQQQNESQSSSQS